MIERYAHAGVPKSVPAPLGEGCLKTNQIISLSPFTSLLTWILALTSMRTDGRTDVNMKAQWSLWSFRAERTTVNKWTETKCTQYGLNCRTF